MWEREHNTKMSKGRAPETELSLSMRAKKTMREKIMNYEGRLSIIDNKTYHKNSIMPTVCIGAWTDRPKKQSRDPENLNTYRNSICVSSGLSNQ